MQNLFGFTARRVLVVRALLVGLFVLVVSPSISHALLKGLPDDKGLKVHVGDPAILEMPVLKKAHDDGKDIILMLGNIDHCVYCEKTWRNIKEAVTPYRPGVLAVLRSHRGSKFSPPEEEAKKLGESYGVEGEPWVFVINKKGIITNIFMGPQGVVEIADALAKLKASEGETPK
jgi:hypothetical protein